MSAARTEIGTALLRRRLRGARASGRGLAAALAGLPLLRVRPARLLAVRLGALRRDGLLRRLALRGVFRRVFGLRLLAGLGLLALARGHLLGGLLDLGVAARVGAGGLARGLFGGLLGIERRHLHLGNGALDELLDVAKRVGRLGAYERHGEARGARSTRAADAVDVILGLGGQVIVHDVVHFLHVDAARQHVGCHEHARLAGGEVVERAAALRLAAVGVDSLGGVARALEAAARGIGAAARAGEHDDAVGALLGQHGLEQRRLEGLRHVDDVLLYGVGRLALVGDLDERRVVQQLAHAVLDGRVDGGREQQRLARGGRGADDLLHGRPEAHVQHAVGLVQHEHLHVAEAHGALFHEVDQAARRGDEDVHAVLELVDLRGVGQAAHHGEDAVMRGGGDGGAHLADLLGQLARGGDHEHERALPALGMAQAVERGQREGRGLAGAGLGGGDEVAPFERERDGLLLDGRGRFVAQARDGFKSLVGQAEFVELLHLSLFSVSVRHGCR